MEVSRLALDLKVSAKVSLVYHELVLRSCYYGSSILALSDVVLCYLEQLLLLQWRNLRSNHHVADIGQCHKGLLHRYVSGYLLQCSPGENDGVLEAGLVITVVILLLLLLLSLVFFIITFGVSLREFGLPFASHGRSCS